ncbi:MAG: DUF6464 family protein [Cyanobacteria bacterium P01_H01_bin.130]
MGLEGLVIGVIFGMALTPAIAAWGLMRRDSATQRLRAFGGGRQVAQRLSTAASVATARAVRGRSPIPEDPEALYIPEVGFVIGDISCQFNGRSPFIRCAVNPSGPCADCRYYQERPDPQSSNGDSTLGDSTLGSTL